MVVFRVTPAAPWIPAALGKLADAAADESIRNVDALLTQWADGSQRFDREGESLLVALDAADQAVGVGGLTRCPHHAGALRVRRFYVLPSARRHGVARAIASELLRLADAHATTVTCNAQASPAASPFWESMGFDRVDAVGITHARVSSGAWHQMKQTKR